MEEVFNSIISLLETFAVGAAFGALVGIFLKIKEYRKKRRLVKKEKEEQKAKENLK